MRRAGARRSLLAVLAVFAFVACGALIAQAGRSTKPPAPKELKVACAQKGTGLMRYVARASRCSRREKAVPVTNEAPIEACVKLHGTRNGVPGSLSQLRAARLGAGSTRLSPPAECPAQTQPNETGIALPGPSKTWFCARRTSGAGNAIGALRWVSRSSKCNTRRELRVFVKARPGGGAVTPGDQPGQGGPGNGPVNHPPNGKADTATTDEDHPVGINVLANDSDDDGDAPQVGSVDATGTKGSVSTNSDGTLTYDPNGKFDDLKPGDSATDAFSYKANDGRSDSSSTDVTVTVTGRNDTPGLKGSSGPATFIENGAPVAIAPGLTASDADSANLDGATVKIASGRDAANDTLDFTPASGITGSYDTGTGVLTLTGSATVAQYQAVLRGVTFESTGDDPAAGARGLELKAKDASGEGAAETRNVVVDAVNDAPVNTVPAAQTMNEDGTFTFPSADSPTVADVDAGSDQLQVTLSAAEGALTLGDPGVVDFTGGAGDGTGDQTMTFRGTASALGTAMDGLAYQPDADHNGSDTVTMTTSDIGHNGSGGVQTDTDTIGFTIDAVNDAPVALDGSLSTDEDAPLTLNLDGLVSDVETADGNVTYEIVAQPANGAATATTYTPNAGFNGSDSLTYKVTDRGDPDNCGAPGPGCDGSETSATKTVSITVDAINNAPVNTVPGAQTIDEDNPLTLSGASAPSISDIDAGSDDVQVTLGVGHGALTLSGTSGLTVTGDGTGTVQATGSLTDLNAALDGVRYDSAANYNGTDTVTMTTSDLGHNGSGGAKTDADTIGVTVNPVNDAPVALDGSLSTDEDAPLTLNLDGLVSDVETADGNLTYEIVGQPANGTATTTTYTPNGNFNGADSLTYKVSDRGDPDNCGAPGPGCDGSETSATKTVSITVAAINDGPVNSVPLALSTAEDVPLPVGALSVADADAAGDDVEVKLSVGNGTLDLGSILGLTFTAGDGSADSTMTFHGTLAAVNGALTTLSYTPAPEYSGPDSLSMETSDLSHNGSGGTLTDSDSTPITVSTVNDAPEVDLDSTQGGSGSTATFDEVVTHDNSVLVAANASVTDVDNDDIGGAAITLANRPDTDAESLSVDTSGTSITAAAYDSTTGVLALTGSDTKAHYQQVIQSLRYANAAAPPDPADRNITVSVNDGTTASNAASATVHVVPLNEPPTLDLNGAAAAGDDSNAMFTEDATPATLAPSADVADTDNANLASATVSLTNRPDGVVESLSASTAGTAIVADSYDSSTGVLFLHGSDTVAHYQQVLRTIAYNNASNTPDTAARNVTFKVNDGLADSPTRTATVTVVAANDAPSVDLNGAPAGANGTATFTEDQPAVTLAGNALVADADSANLASATVTLTNHPDGSAESLTVDPTGTSITASYNNSTGVLSLSGSDTLAHYQQVLRTVKYDNTSQNASTADRVVSFVVNDGAANSNSPTVTVTVQVVNDPPTVDMNGGGAGNDSTAAFTETSLPQFAGSGPVTLGPSANVGDVDNTNLTSADVTLTNHPDGASESLAATTAGTSVTADAYNSSTGVLHLHGTDTVAHYQQVLRTVAYNNTSNTPSTTDRALHVVANDGSASSTTAHTTVTVAATNDQPTAGTDSFNGANRAVRNTSLVVDSARGGTPDPTGPQKTVSGDIKANDSDPEGDGLTFTAETVSTTAGGNADITADGDFTYRPPASCTNSSDSFTYHLVDGHGGTNGTANGTVNLAAADCVWYVDASKGSNGNGTASSPFNTLAASGGHGLAGAGGSGDDDAAGDRIFLYPGTYTGGLPLENNEELITKRHGLTVPDGGGGAGTVTLEGPAAGTDQLNGGLVLAGGNNVQGVDLGDSGSSSVFALSGSSVGTAHVNDTTAGLINNPSGGAVNIGGSGNVLNMTFSSLSSSGSSTNAINIAGASGTFTGNGNGTVQNAIGTDVVLGSGSLAFTLNSAISDTSGQIVSITGQTGGAKSFSGSLNSTGGGISLSSNSGGTTTFSGSTKTLNTGSNDAVSMASSDGHTLTLSGGALDIDTTSGTGVTATTSGTISITGAGNTINTATGRAVNVTDTDFGAGGATLAGVTTTGAAPNGVRIDGASGNLTVTGATAIGTSGGSGPSGTALSIANYGAGVISFGPVNIDRRGNTGVLLDNVDGSSAGFGITTIPNQANAGGYGIRVEDSSAAVTFAAANISNTNETSAQTDADNNGLPENEGDGDGIFLINNGGSFTLNDGLISTLDNEGIDVRSSKDLTLDGVEISEPGQTANGALSSGYGGHAIQAINLTGTNTIKNSNINHWDIAARDGLRWWNTGSTPGTMTIDNTTFENSTGSNAILNAAKGSSDQDLIVKNNTKFQSIGGAAITHNAENTSDADLTVQNTQFLNAKPGGQNDMSARNLDGAKTTILIENNTFDGVSRTLQDTSGTIDLGGDALDPGSEFVATVQNNTIKNIGLPTQCLAPASSLPCTGKRAIDVFIDDNTIMGAPLVIKDNTVTDVYNSGLVMEMANNSGSTTSAKVTGNTFGTPAAPVGKLGTLFGASFGRRRFGGPDGNIRFDNNTVTNNNSTGNINPALIVTSTDDARQDFTATGNTITNLGTAADVLFRAAFPTGGGSPTLCADFAGNAVGGGSGTIMLREDTTPAPGSILQIEQANSAALASANGIPAGNILTAGAPGDGAPSFGATCAAPPP